jgi:hypothetical protein
MKKVFNKYRKILSFLTILVFCFIASNLVFNSKAFAAGYIAPIQTAAVSNNDYSPIVAFPEWEAISGHYLYVGNNIANALVVYDISDPSHLVEVGSLSDGVGGASMKSPEGVFISGNYAYTLTQTATAGDTLEIVNISDPTHPVHAGSIVNGTGGGLGDFSGNTLTFDVTFPKTIIPFIGGSSGGGTTFGCKDPKATNYNPYSVSEPSLCIYANTLPVTPPTAPTNPAQTGQGTTSKYIFTKTLKYKMTDLQVKYLQIVLNQSKDTEVTIKGNGSSGKEITYFGKATLAAVKRFQKKYQLTADGIVGPKTRTKLMEREG